MKIFSNINHREWQKVCDHCHYATFFHGPTWINIFTETYSYLKNASVKFEFSEGVSVIMPLVKDEKNNEIFSNIAGVYGLWVSEEKITSSQAGQILKWLEKTGVKCTFRLNPFNKINYDSLIAPKAKIKKDFTQMLELKKDHDEIKNDFSKGHRYNIKKSRQIGVKISEADSLADYREYYKIYLDSLRRWGDKATNNYPLALFENIFYQKNNNIKLWLATHKNRIISGALVFYCNKNAVWWHGATLADCLQYYPANLLQNEIIKNACLDGYHYYDLNPSGGHAGVIRFKRSFGAKKSASDVVVYNNPVFLKKLWNKMQKNVKRFF